MGAGASVKQRARGLTGGSSSSPRNSTSSSSSPSSSQSSLSPYQGESLSPRPRGDTDNGEEFVLDREHIGKLADESGLTHKEIKNLLDEFKKIDVDNSGTITRDELRALIRKRYGEGTSTLVYAIFAVFDSNGDKDINFREFVLALESLTQPTIEEVVDIGFRAFDLNNDGQITKDEVKEVMLMQFKLKKHVQQYRRKGKLGEVTLNFQESSQVTTDAELLFREIDTDNSKSISYAEFQAALTAKPALKAKLADILLKEVNMLFTGTDATQEHAREGIISKRTNRKTTANRVGSSNQQAASAASAHVSAQQQQQQHTPPPVAARPAGLGQQQQQQQQQPSQYKAVAPAIAVSSAQCPRCDTLRQRVASLEQWRRVYDAKLASTGGGGACPDCVDKEKHRARVAFLEEKLRQLLPRLKVAEDKVRAAQQ